MKNLKFLSFALIISVLVIAWCDNSKPQEDYSCNVDEACPVEVSIDTPTVEIEDLLSVIDEWDSEWDEEIILENNEVNDNDMPMMRKMLVDENATLEEIEQDMVETCAGFGWNWSDWTCILEDGTQIAF